MLEKVYVVSHDEIKLVESSEDSRDSVDSEDIESKNDAAEVMFYQWQTINKKNAKAPLKSVSMMILASLQNNNCSGNRNVKTLIWWLCACVCPRNPKATLSIKRTNLKIILLAFSENVGRWQKKTNKKYKFYY